MTFRKTRHVVVHDFGNRFILKVDSYSCSCCNSIVTVHPFDVDCAATTPTEECETWIPLKCIQFFEDVHYRNGLAADGKPCLSSFFPSNLLPSILIAAQYLSLQLFVTLPIKCHVSSVKGPNFLTSLFICCFTAYCHAMAGLERQYQPEGCDLVNSVTGDKIVAGPLKASNLITAAMEFGKVDSEVGRHIKTTSDPLVECLVCAYSARETLRNGKMSLDSFFRYFVQGSMQKKQKLQWL